MVLFTRRYEGFQKIWTEDVLRTHRVGIQLTLVDTQQCQVQSGLNYRDNNAPRFLSPIWLSPAGRISS